MEKRSVLSYGSLKLPDHARLFFKEEYDHIAFIRDDNLLIGAVENCTWRVYPANLHAFRENFAKRVERIMQWVQRLGSDAMVVRKHFPGSFAMCRRGDYVVFSITEPVASTLEHFGCLPERHIASKSA